MRKSKKVLPTLMLLALVLLSQSCMRMETVVNVNKDGSGTIDLTMTIAEAMVGMVMSLAGEDEAAGSDIPFNEASFVEMGAAYGEDVELVSYEEISEEGYIGGRATFSFPDINKIRVAIFPDKDDSDYSFEFSEKGKKRQLKILTNYKESEEPEVIVEEAAADVESGDEPALSEKELVELEKQLADLEEQLGEGTDELTAMFQSLGEQADLMATFFEGMHISFKLNVDGRIVRTNSKHAGRKSLTIFEMDMGQLMGNEELMAALVESGGTPDNVKDFEDIKGVVFDNKEVIEVIFR